MDVLRQPFSWDALKRVIKTEAVKIEDPAEFYGFSTAGLRPEPIPVSVKVIMVGPRCSTTSCRPMKKISRSSLR